MTIGSSTPARGYALSDGYDSDESVEVVDEVSWNFVLPLYQDFVVYKKLGTFNEHNSFPQLIFYFILHHYYINHKSSS